MVIAVTCAADCTYPHQMKAKSISHGLTDVMYGMALISHQLQVHKQSGVGYSQVETSTSNPSYPHSSQHDENLRNTMDSNASTLKGISSLQSEAMSSGVEDKVISGSSIEKKTISGWESSDLKGQ